MTQQPPMTYRQMDNDEEAPPSYEAAISISEVPQITRSFQQYPVLQMNSQNNVATTIQPSPAPYYPVMPNAPSSPTTFTAAPYSQYPGMPINMSSQNQTSPYPGMPSQHHQPSSLYPTMSTQTLSTPYPSPFPNSHPLPHNQPSAPISLIDGSSSNPIPGHQVSQHENVIYQDRSFQSEDLMQFNDQQDEVSFPAHTSGSPQPNSTMLVAPVPAIELVTSYKCKKCGAHLETDTAVCKRLHAPAAIQAERLVQNATRKDLGERARRDYEAEGQGSSTSASDRSSLERSRSNSASVRSYDITHDDGRSEEQSTSRPLETVPSHENNYGTDEVYFRTPFNAIKKFWRESKGESSNQRSETQRIHEIVAPLPIPYPVYDDSSNLGRSNSNVEINSSVAPYNPYMPHTSNSFSGYS